MKIPVSNVAHIAIPTHDKSLAVKFYSEILGGVVSREYDDRVTFELFDHQLVCHLSPSHKPLDDAENPLKNVYPSHFGITFLDEKDIKEIYLRLSEAGLPYIQPLMTRFGNLPERHLTFFVADPTHNIVEFKWYEDKKYVY